MKRFVFFVSAIALVITACQPATVVPPTPTPAPTQPIPTALPKPPATAIPTIRPANTAAPIFAGSAEMVQPNEVDAKVEAAWKMMRLPPNSTWSMAQTPPMPSEWPPTQNTIWTTHLYAIGVVVPVKAGAPEQVSRPWGSIDVRAIAQSYTLSVARDAIVANAQQGVRPLTPQEQGILNSRQVVTDFARKLTALPSDDRNEAKTMRAFYRAWFDINGAILPYVAPPDGFRKWVAQ